MYVQHSPAVCRAAIVVAIPAASSLKFILFAMVEVCALMFFHVLSVFPVDAPLFFPPFQTNGSII